MRKAVLWSVVPLIAGSLSACSSSGGSGSSCNSCPSSGATQCAGIQIQTCTADAKGCLAWSTATACPGNLTCNSGQGKCIDHPVTFNWTPNRESGVNQSGGGYQLLISGQPMIGVPYVSGPAAPTSAMARLPPGTYTVTVRAYAALDAQGGSTASLSAPSQSLTVTVP